ncbi:low temperature requirement protein A [Saccharomonospora sp. NPDC046836]|uniref:low temperature requirement protein A n=1 Tax=Saccharomonospora sp. NPDC046836 TaxID=3156921 RepID=UPI0033D77C71
MTSPASRSLRRMIPRDPREEHRAASPLELFFDLVFVVAIATSSAQLHHAESEQHIGAGIGAYLMVFFAIWWAWMNFTWFATAFDTDDWLYRLLTLLQMAGVLVLAAGTGPAMADGDFLVVTVGYVIMRLALVSQWLRAAASSPELRGTALRYAAGITVVQILWVARLWLPEQGGVTTFLLLVVAELLVPILAERHRPTPWHPEHIAERYGLLTLIVLGESILASTNAIVDAIDHTEHIGPLLLIAACGLVLAAGMWWIYFSREHDEHLTSLRRALTFGYGHYVIFAAAGSFSAGIEVAIDHDTNQTGLSAAAAAATLTIPVAVFVLGAWWLTLRHTLSRTRNIAIATLGILIAATALAPASLVLAALGVVVVVTILETSDARTGANP